MMLDDRHHEMEWTGNLPSDWDLLKVPVVYEEKVLEFHRFFYHFRSGMTT